MPDEINQLAAAQPKFEIARPEDGTPHIYANVSFLTWTGMDISVKLYELVQPNREIEGQDLPNALMERAVVTFPWVAAKNFQRLLNDVIARYEKVNGEIKTEFKAI
jgi:hypothetical protein